MFALSDIIAVASGGALGATCRYCMQMALPLSPKWAILAVNLVGCLLIGLVWGLAERMGLPRWVTLLAVTGFLGGFTTFSTFSFDIMSMLREGLFMQAASYTLLSLAGGVAVTFLSYYFTKP